MDSYDIFYTLLMVFGTIAIIQILGVMKVERAFPPAFFAIVIMTFIEHFVIRLNTNFENRTIEETAEIDGDIIKQIGIPTTDMSRINVPMVLYYSVVLALVGIVESLLTLEALL